MSIIVLINRLNYLLPYQLMNYNFLTPDTIEELHIEVSNLCNAACPQCARNNSGYGLTENPGWGHWNKGDEKLVFSNDLSNLKKVFFCGTHGDPLTYPHLIDTIIYCKQRNLAVEIFTNGSLRSTQWWTKLLQNLKKDDKIIFGIDGIETNHLYRQNTNINKILKNLMLSTQSEVKIQWDFLVFKHNEHEIENCKKLAKELGVSKFRLRKTARFSNDKVEVRNKNNEITHYLEPSVNPELRHPDFIKIKNLYKKLPEEYDIKCIYKEAKKIYINSRLEVFPCCYISDNNERNKINLDKSKLQIPLSELSLRSKSWCDILNNSFYKEELIKSFYGNNTIDRCIFTCGVVSRESNQNQVIKI